MSKTSDKMRRLCWDRTKCSTCLSCVVVCSERHTGMSAPSRALIHLRVGLFDGCDSAEYCRQCEDAPCAAVCPAQAISLDGRLQCWCVDKDLCIGCGECVDACQYGAIQLDAVTGVAAKCDLCLGAVRCVEICPTKALSLECMDEEQDVIECRRMGG